MSINGIGGSFYQEQMDHKNKVKNQKNRSFDHEFRESYWAKSGEKTDTENAVEKEVRTEKAAGQTVVYSGINSLNISSAVVSKAVSECDIKNISYAECDYVKNCIEEGYTLKAVVSKENRSVYIEQKSEDGTVKAYQVDMTKVEQDTENVIEQAALESWEQGKKSSVNDDWQQAMEEFAAYVKDRIKNGPPKVMIGASEFSIEEWDKLVKNLDDTIDEIKQEQAQRLEKLKEAEEKKEMLLEELEEEQS